MSAAAFGRSLPAVVTLDDLAALNTADQHGRRFELSPEGALSVLPLPDAGHAAIASRLIAWFLLAGWPAEQVLHAVGVRIPGPEFEGGRIPDLTLWARPQAGSEWLTTADLLLVVEIVSSASAAVDEVVKRAEYAAAGIPQYWVIERDAAQTVMLYVLGPDRTYGVAAKIPMAWLLQTAPADHHLDG